MRSKVLNEQGERTFALVFETGEEPIHLLTQFADERHLNASRFTAIGAFSEVVLGYFDWEKKDYRRMPFPEQLEVLSLVSDIARAEVRPNGREIAEKGERRGMVASQGVNRPVPNSSAGRSRRKVVSCAQPRSSLIAAEQLPRTRCWRYLPCRIVRLAAQRR